MENNSEVTTVICIRHAERDNPAAADPHLNANGINRAKSLTHILDNAEIEAIYTSRFARTKETASFLAAHLGISPVQIDEAAAIKAHILEHRRGKTVLVVGHTNTIPELITLLGSTIVFAIGENKFDHLFILTNSSQEVTKTTLLKYGTPS